MADGTLSPNSRELKDGEVVDISELTPEGYSISQDVEDTLYSNYVSPSMVNDEEQLLKQARVKIPQPPLPWNKGKGCAWTPSKDSVITRPHHTSSWISQREPSYDDE
jgi:hypothetical protein